MNSEVCLHTQALLLAAMLNNDQPELTNNPGSHIKNPAEYLRYCRPCIPEIRSATSPPLQRNWAKLLSLEEGQGKTTANQKEHQRLAHISQKNTLMNPKVSVGLCNYQGFSFNISWNI